jgi:hypothetical protein
MPDPHDTLSIFAEVAVALAGFSGIVIAFGRRSRGSLTPLELRRLSNLYASSGLVLFCALLGNSLLHVESLPAAHLWRGASALVFLLGGFLLFWDWSRVRGLEPAERAEVKAYILYPFNVVGVLTLILQLVNAFVLAKSWPFLIGLVFALTFAFQQFILMVRMGFRDV